MRDDLSGEVWGLVSDWLGPETGRTLAACDRRLWALLVDRHVRCTIGRSGHGMGLARLLRCWPKVRSLWLRLSLARQGWLGLLEGAPRLECLDLVLVDDPPPPGAEDDDDARPPLPDTADDCPLHRLPALRRCCVQRPADGGPPVRACLGAGSPGSWAGLRSLTLLGGGLGVSPWPGGPGRTPWQLPCLVEAHLQWAPEPQFAWLTAACPALRDLTLDLPGEPVGVITRALARHATLCRRLQTLRWWFQPGHGPEPVGGDDDDDACTAVLAACERLTAVYLGLDVSLLGDVGRAGWLASGRRWPPSLRRYHLSVTANPLDPEMPLAGPLPAPAVGSPAWEEVSLTVPHGLALHVGGWAAVRERGCRTLHVRVGPDDGGPTAGEGWWTQILAAAFAGPGPRLLSLDAGGGGAPFQSDDAVGWVVRWRRAAGAAAPATVAPAQCWMNLRGTRIGDDGLAALVGGVPPFVEALWVAVDGGTEVRLLAPLPGPPPSLRCLGIVVGPDAWSPPLGWLPGVDPGTVAWCFLPPGRPWWRWAGGDPDDEGAPVRAVLLQR